MDDKAFLRLANLFLQNRPVSEELFEYLAQDPFGINDYKPYVNEIRSTPIERLTAKQVQAYLLLLVRKERVWAEYSASIESGLLASLLKRYIELNEA